MTIPASAPIVRTLRHRAFRKFVTAKFVWYYLTREYDLRTPQVIKIRPTALALGIKKDHMRRAVRLLVRLRFLDVVVEPTDGTPGAYVAGPRAYRLKIAEHPRPTVMGARGGAPVDTETLPLFPDPA